MEANICFCHQSPTSPNGSAWPGDQRPCGSALPTPGYRSRDRGPAGLPFAGRLPRGGGGVGGLGRGGVGGGAFGNQLCGFCGARISTDPGVKLAKPIKALADGQDRRTSGGGGTSRQGEGGDAPRCSHKNERAPRVESWFPCCQGLTIRGTLIQDFGKLKEPVSVANCAQDLSLCSMLGIVRWNCQPNKAAPCSDVIYPRPKNEFFLTLPEPYNHLVWWLHSCSRRCTFWGSSPRSQACASHCLPPGSHLPFSPMRSWLSVGFSFVTQE